MAGVKFNSSFYKNIEAIVTPTARKAMSDLSHKTARWGIKGQGDLPMIMGVLEFGDPDHTWPNTPKGSRNRKFLELNATFGEENNPSAIPPRPWLRRSVEGYYRKEIVKYINENLPTVLSGFPKRGQSVENKKSRMSADKFIEGLAKVGRDNAEMSWEIANFEPNAPATLELKDDPRPLHGNGVTGMSGDAITAWSD